MTSPLLDHDEPPAVEIRDRTGHSLAVITCDHARNRVPRVLGDLGLGADALAAHVAWDPGALQVAERLAWHLDAPLVASGYSRLVIDLNRPLGVPTSIAEVSETTEVPGNRDLTPEDTHARAEALFWPYHNTLGAFLDERLKQPRPPRYVAIHSFTPVYFGDPREMEVCISWHTDDRMAQLVLPRLREDDALIVAENEPFAITLRGDFGIPQQAERRGLPNVMIEVRQDLIASEEAAHAWGDRLAHILAPILDDPSLDELRPLADLPPFGHPPD
jgi:predicted N-formylglutamate amidohydrolase